MIDHRYVVADPAAISGITLMQDQYLGLNIITPVQDGHVIVSLSAETAFDVTFLNPDEGPGPRFFIPKCELRLDHTAVGDARKDPPLGSLIVAKVGISLMVRPPRSGPSPLRLTGDPIKNAYEGLAITSWQLLSSTAYGKPEILYAFKYAPLGGSG